MTVHDHISSIRWNKSYISNLGFASFCELTLFQNLPFVFGLFVFCLLVCLFVLSIFFVALWTWHYTILLYALRFYHSFLFFRLPTYSVTFAWFLNKPWWLADDGTYRICRVCQRLTQINILTRDRATSPGLIGRRNFCSCCYQISLHTVYKT